MSLDFFRRAGRRKLEPFTVVSGEDWRIERQPATGDFALYVAEDYKGSFEKQHEAEQERNRIMTSLAESEVAA